MSFCKKCGALLGADEHEICNSCSKDDIESQVMEMVDYKTMCAAMAGDKGALNKVVDHYAPYIEKLCTHIEYINGKKTTVVDKNLKEEVTQRFIQDIMTCSEERLSQIEREQKLLELLKN